jgi:lantibiotic structural protein beta
MNIHPTPKERKMKEENLELGQYLESDMLALSDEDVDGGGSPSIILSVITGYISRSTCPSTACTTQC